jgi:hypothetical protein
MITVSQATEKIINRSRYLSEAISKGLINTSALARYIRPEVEEMLVKNVSEAAILMAINRLSLNIKPKYTSHDVLKKTPEIILRSQLTLIFYKDIAKIAQVLQKITKFARTQQSFFITAIQSNSFVVCSEDYLPSIQNFIEKTKHVSAITIILPNDVLDTPGICYFFIKSLAWEGINIIEVVSVKSELTFILEDNDAQNAYGILNSLVKQ